MDMSDLPSALYKSLYLPKEEENQESGRKYGLLQEWNEFEEISIKHLKIVLDVLKIERPQDVINKLDPTHKGVVPLERLWEVIKMKKYDKLSEEELRRAFKLMDEENKGFLTFSDLKKISEQMDEKMSEEELYEMLDEVDTNSCGVVNEDQFVKFMKLAAEDSVNCNCK